MSAKSLYQDLVEAGCETDNHESDLYVRYSPTALKIVKDHATTHKTIYGLFTDRTGQCWVEVPFYYAPFWAKKVPH